MGVSIIGMVTLNGLSKKDYKYIQTQITRQIPVQILSTTFL